MGNVGKPSHLPAGKARADEPHRHALGLNTVKLNEQRDMNLPNPTPVPRGDEEAPLLHGGQRPGVRSRIQEAVEENDELKAAEGNYIRNKAPFEE